MDKELKCRGLKINAQKKSNDAIKRAEDTIIKLIEDKQNINFSIVSKESGLSRSFLYNNLKIRQLIQNHRGVNYLDKNKRYKRETKTDKSKDVIIAAKDAKIKKLELEIEELKAQLKKYKGILYEKI